MKTEGLYSIIFSIKEFYGQDIAIISSEELNPNHYGNCKELVINYIPGFTWSNENIELSKKSINEILSEKFPSEEAQLIYDNIIKNKNQRIIFDFKNKSWVNKLIKK